MPESYFYNKEGLVYCHYLRNAKEDMLQSESISVKSAKGHRFL
jgi:hypothetical protein